VRGDHEPRTLGWVEELCLDDPRQDEIAQSPIPVPALIGVLDHNALGPSPWVEVGQRSQPWDPGGAVPLPPAPVGILEMVGQEPGVGLAEAKCPEFFEGVRSSVQAETSGSGLTIPTPRSRFVAAIASASPTIACETSASGSAKTIGSPSSA
jgi:hypothetical protein